MEQLKGRLETLNIYFHVIAKCASEEWIRNNVGREILPLLSEKEELPILDLLHVVLETKRVDIIMIVLENLKFSNSQARERTVNFCLESSNGMLLSLICSHGTVSNLLFLKRILPLSLNTSRVRENNN